MFAFDIITITFYLMNNKICIKFAIHIINYTKYITYVELCRIYIYNGVCKYSKKLVLLNCSINNNNN
jgi:hypothetical protein